MASPQDTQRKQYLQPLWCPLPRVCFLALGQISLVALMLEELDEGLPSGVKDQFRHSHKE